MAVVIDTVARRPARAIPKGRIGRTSRRAQNPTGSGSRRRSFARLCRDASASCARTACTRLCEEAGCPNIGECWEKKHATLHDHGRHLHAGLRLLQRQDRHSGARSTPWSRATSARGDRKTRAGARRRHLRRSRRSRRRRGRRTSPPSSARSARAARTPRSKCWTPDFLRKDGAVDIVAAAKPDIFNHNLEDGAVQISDRCAGRALLCLHPRASARQGNRPVFVSPNPASWLGLGEGANDCCK